MNDDNNTDDDNKNDDNDNNFTILDAFRLK